MPVHIKLRGHPSPGIVDIFSHGEVTVEGEDLIVFLPHPAGREVLARYLLEDVETYTVERTP